MCFDKLMYFLIICFCLYKLLDFKSVKYNPEFIHPASL